MFDTSKILPDTQELAQKILESPKLREAALQWLGRAPHETAAGQAIYHMDVPTLGMKFEWHTQQRVVYRMVERNGHEEGDGIASDIETHGDAKNAVNIYTRGVRAGMDLLKGMPNG